LCKLRSAGGFAAVFWACPQNEPVLRCYHRLLSWLCQLLTQTDSLICHSERILINRRCPEISYMH
jgi:hypothetical protein